MIVMAEREFLAPHQLKPGQSYEINSGMGGSWTVKFIGTRGGLFCFLRKAKPDWPAATFKYKHEEIESKIYVLVPNYEDAHLLVYNVEGEERKERERVIRDRIKRLNAGEKIMVDKHTRWICQEAVQGNTDWND